MLFNSNLIEKLALLLLHYDSVLCMELVVPKALLKCRQRIGCIVDDTSWIHPLEWVRPSTIYRLIINIYLIVIIIDIPTERPVKIFGKHHRRQEDEEPSIKP